MATPPIPPRPVSYVSYAADGEDQINGNVLNFIMLIYVIHFLTF